MTSRRNIAVALLLLHLVASVCGQQLPCPPNPYCPTAAAPYQCFVANGSASRCCPQLCSGAPPSDPNLLCGTSVTPTLPVTPGTGPQPYTCTITPAPTTPQPSPVPNPNCPTAAAPNQCFVADGSASRCCPSLCTTPPPAKVADLCGGTATATAPLLAATSTSTTPGTTAPVATTPAGTTALATVTGTPAAPTARSPVVNPYAAGQLCASGKAPQTCPTASGQAPCSVAGCLRYPTAQCVADSCDSCKAKYNLNVGLPGDYVGWEVNCSCPSFTVAFGSAYTPSTPTPCKPDPCATLKCPAVPDAFCITDTCGGCNAIFLKNGVEVDCGVQTRFPNANFTAGVATSAATAKPTATATGVPIATDVTSTSAPAGSTSQQTSTALLSPGTAVTPTAPTSGALGLQQSVQLAIAVAAVLIAVLV